MTVHIALVEDEDSCAADITGYLERYQREHQREFEVKRFTNGLDFIEGSAAPFDIIFMDIRMPMMNGLEAARKMRQAGIDTPLIFVTNMAQYAISGYEVDAIDFILKPVGYFNFSVKLNKALQRLERSRERHRIPVQLRDGVTLLEAEAIRYVEIRSHDLTFHVDGWAFESRGTLKKLEEQLAGRGFARCSSSYLVNLRWVTAIQDGEVLVRDGSAGTARLKISRRHKAKFEAALVEHLGEV